MCHVIATLFLYRCLTGRYSTILHSQGENTSTIDCNWGNLAAEERHNCTSLANIHSTEIKKKRSATYSKVHESYLLGQKKKKIRIYKSNRSNKASVHIFINTGFSTTGDDHVNGARAIRKVLYVYSGSGHKVG